MDARLNQQNEIRATLGQGVACEANFSFSGVRAATERGVVMARLDGEAESLRAYKLLRK